MIYYIGPYIKLGNPNSFIEFPSASNKMDYLISAIRYYDEVQIISIGESYSNSFPKRLENIYYLGTLSKKYRIIARLFLQLQILWFTLIKLPKNSKVIIYHTYLLIPLVRFLKKIKKIELIYEIEEIYNAAWEKKKLIDKEIKDIRFADKYILVNDILKDKLKLEKKSIVCYGDYRKKVQNVNYKTDLDVLQQINCVYAGVIGNENSDVYLAIQSMQFLPDNYKLFIAGYGEAQNITHLKKILQEKNYEGKIIYCGLLKDKEYDDFMFGMHIGLNTRRLSNEFSDYTFPSKVMVYMGYGLKVVSSKIDCIVNSKIAENIYFFDQNDPKCVSQTILSVNNENLNSELLDTLNSNFINDLKNI